MHASLRVRVGAGDVWGEIQRVKSLISATSGDSGDSKRDRGDSANVIERGQGKSDLVQVDSREAATHGQ